MVVFRPFRGEVLVARIASQTADGINRESSFGPVCAAKQVDLLQTPLLTHLQSLQISFTTFSSLVSSCRKARNCKIC